MLVRILRLIRSRTYKPQALGCCSGVFVLLAIGIAVAVLLTRCVPTDERTKADEEMERAVPGSNATLEAAKARAAAAKN